MSCASAERGWLLHVPGEVGLVQAVDREQQHVLGRGFALVGARAARARRKRGEEDQPRQGAHGQESLHHNTFLSQRLPVGSTLARERMPWVDVR